MANVIKSNPEGCWKNEQDKPVDCAACYWSNVVDNKWVGSGKCWNAECLVLVKEKNHGQRKDPQ